MKTAFIVMGFALLSGDRTVHVKLPIFSQTEFPENDQLRFVDFYDQAGARIYPSQANYLQGVDSCAAHLVFDVTSGYHPVTVLQDHRHKLIATYKRISDTSWVSWQDGNKTVLIEDRNTLVTRDTMQLENPLNPGEITVLVTEYYPVKSQE